MERAAAIGAEKIQLIRDAYTPDMITRAHEQGIRVNLFYSDEPEEAVSLIESGVDCILTNDYLLIKRALRK